MSDTYWLAVQMPSGETALFSFPTEAGALESAHEAAANGCVCIAGV